MKTTHTLMALIVVGLIAWTFMNSQKDGFSAFYYGPRRDPQEFKRHPLSY